VSGIAILCVEDEPEVRAALARDLAPFDGPFRLEFSEDVPEARSVLGDLEAAGTEIGLILADHLLPGVRGIDFLIELHQVEATRPTRKVLITGQAGLEDTVRAVNQADLDHFIAKPWTAEQLHEVVREQLTDYVIEHAGDLLPYVPVLDGARLLEAISARGWSGRRT
jgi:two-component system chemotaxis response regulator CheY